MLSERRYAEAVIKKSSSCSLSYRHLQFSNQVLFYGICDCTRSAILSIKVKENIKLNYDNNLHMPAILWQIVVYFLGFIYLKGQEGIS